jgi:hypothetical protein
VAVDPKLIPGDELPDSGIRTPHRRANKQKAIPCDLQRQRPPAGTDQSVYFHIVKIPQRLEKRKIYLALALALAAAEKSNSRKKSRYSSEEESGSCIRVKNLAYIFHQINAEEAACTAASPPPICAIL